MNKELEGLTASLVWTTHLKVKNGGHMDGQFSPLPPNEEIPRTGHTEPGGEHGHQDRKSRDLEGMDRHLATTTGDRATTPDSACGGPIEGHVRPNGDCPGAGA